MLPNSFHFRNFTPRVWASALTLVLLLLGPVGAEGQVGGEGTVRGQILDGRSGRGIPGALVELLDNHSLLRASATTGEDGGFVLSRVLGGEFRLRVSSLGYAPTLSTLHRIEAGESLTVVLRVHPAALALAPLEVTVSARSTSPVLESFYQRARGGSEGVFFTRDDIVRLGPARLGDLLARVPGLRVEGPGFSGLPSGLRMSESLSEAPAGSCAPSLFVDGAPVGRGRGFSAMGLDALESDALPSLWEVEGVEVYRSLAETPPLFRTPDARCGVVVIWRRPTL
jgi:hypothetical protein